MEVSSSSSAILSRASIPKHSPPGLPQQSFSSASSLFFNNGIRTHDSIISKRNTLTLSRNRRGTCRSMFGLSMPEIAVIAGIATLVFGPKKLPDIGWSLGQTVKSFQNVRFCSSLECLSSRFVLIRSFQLNRNV
ncbi:hypothetical protein Scep_024173 [Stephania cephalantha]|uniref:Uncharacterized protein n=1 Tax=Stephania cephalantha TaxID=152367 RepID=A0AAP0F1I9_9MAGN